jgi:hypothetical protein
LEIIMNTVDVEPVVPVAEPELASDKPDAALGDVLALADFVDEFGDGLLNQVRAQNPPIDDGQTREPRREAAIDALKRKPFPAQRQAVHTVVKLLLDEDLPAAVINAEMGTGKTMMAISAAAVLNAEGLKRTLVISPPHLVYKWRREIKETVPGARVWILNGPDTLRKLLMLRAALGAPASAEPEFFVLGRVRMRMGFHWRAAVASKRSVDRNPDGRTIPVEWAACPRCGTVVSRDDADGHPMPLSLEMARLALSSERSVCVTCAEPLWTLMRPGRPARSYRELVLDALRQMPTIGPKTAERLLNRFGEELLGSMLGDNVYEFLYLMDEGGDLVFSDRQASRMERALANFEFSFGEGGYQPTEFIKRYLPQGYFGLLIVDEGHEYKNEGSAQGQAMGVLARKCTKTVLLTGTLMGGYADDLFFLLWRLHPGQMIADGFAPNERGSMSGAAMGFMRTHGVLKDIYKETGRTSHRTAKGTHTTHRVSKAPGFGPKGIMRYVLPMTVFLKLKEIGQKVLPSYDEYFTSVPMTEAQHEAYVRLSTVLVRELKQALRAGDNSLLGVVLNVLLAWPDCAFRTESVVHPHTKRQLALQPAVLSEGEPSPKEQALIDLCLKQKALHRRVLAYTVYTGTRDTTARVKALLDERGFKVAVLRASVEATQREDWVAEQVERGIDVLICNPELVKTGLDLLEFPTIVFLQSGYNVYTVQQAARRSWRIGQKLPVEVHYLGYAGSAQMECLKLMAKKIAVSQSTSGDMPDSGLDVLNDSGDSIEVALAKQLLG